jgi:hypothetical protein
MGSNILTLNAYKKLFGDWISIQKKGRKSGICATNQILSASVNRKLPAVSRQAVQKPT